MLTLSRPDATISNELLGASGNVLSLKHAFEQRERSEWFVEWDGMATVVDPDEGVCGGLLDYSVDCFL